MQTPPPPPKKKYIHTFLVDNSIVFQKVMLTLWYVNDMLMISKKKN